LKRKDLDAMAFSCAGVHVTDACHTNRQCPFPVHASYGRGTPLAAHLLNDAESVSDMSQQPAAPGKGTREDRASGQTRTTHDQSLDAQVTCDPDGRARPRVAPALPHELDESARSQACASARQVEIGRRALEDELSPSVDTDRGPVLDQVYHELVATDRGRTPPRR
jgi:hypothetical protein